MPLFDVVGMGMSTMDILTTIPRLPASNDVFPAYSVDLQGGGPVATALVTLARLGSRTAYIGTIAGDRWGEEILRDLEKYAVDCRWSVRYQHGQSAISVILVEADTGHRAILYEKARLPSLKADQVPQEILRQAQILHLDSSQLEAAIPAARSARKNGVTISFDGGAGKIGSKVEELLPLVDILIVARGFAEQVSASDDVHKIGPALLRYGAAMAVMTDGENGCWYWDGQTHFHQKAYSVGVRDTTGAGDVFHGAYLYALLQKWSHEKCVSFASAVAALKCARVGGRLGIPTLPEALAFLKEREGIE